MELRIAWACDGCVSLLTRDELCYDRNRGVVFCVECWEDYFPGFPRVDALLCESCGAPMRWQELSGSAEWRGGSGVSMFCSRCSEGVSDEDMQRAIDRLTRMVDDDTQEG